MTIRRCYQYLLVLVISIPGILLQSLASAWSHRKVHVPCAVPKRLGWRAIVPVPSPGTYLAFAPRPDEFVGRKRPRAKSNHCCPMVLSSNGSNDAADADDADQMIDPLVVQAEQLRLQAARARKEAERMESALALEQIAKLEDRLEKAAANATMNVQATSNNTTAGEENATDDAEMVRERIRTAQRRIRRETDVGRLLAEDSKSSRFCSAVLEVLSVAPADADVDHQRALVAKEAKEAGLTGREAAELFANVVNCMIIEKIDAASVALSSNATAADALNGVLDFMGYSSSVFEPLLSSGKVIIRPITYEGTMERSELEDMYASFVVSSDAADEVGDLLRSLFDITEERAEVLWKNRTMEHLVGAMRGDEEVAVAESAEDDDAIGMGELISELQSSLQEFEESVAGKSEDDEEAIKEVKQVSDAVGGVAEAITEFVEFLDEDGDLREELNFDELLLDDEELAAVRGFMGNATTDGETEEFRELILEVGGFLKGAKTFGVDFTDFLQGVKANVKEGTKLSQGVGDLAKQDPSVNDRVETLVQMFPPEFYDGSKNAEQEYIDQFITELQRNEEIFELSSKPQNIYFAHLVEGVNKLDSGDALTKRLDGLIEKKGLQDKISFFLVRFPKTEIMDDDLSKQDVVSSVLDEGGSPADVLSAMESFAAPSVLLVTGTGNGYVANLSDIVKSNALGVASISYFVLSCFNLNEGLLSADWGYISMLFLALVGTQLLHEIGHFVAASIHGVRLVFPIICPWPWTGLLGTKTELHSSPRNSNALFDIAAVGPIVGMVSSVASLLAGLKIELAMDQTALLELPRLPLETLEKTSWLTSSIVESVAGFDVLSSLDPTSSSIPCHPLVISGYIGIIVNGLSLVPFASQTDGFRMCRAAGGFLATGYVPVLGGGFLLVQGVREMATSNLLLVYFLATLFFFNGKDVPCVNDVDTTGSTRYGIFLATSLLAFVSLSPCL